MRFSGCVLLLCFCAAPVFGQSKSLSGVQKRALDQTIGKLMKQEQAVGLAVGIVQNGRVAFTKAYGYEDAERKVKATSKTMFRWASVSKVITAYAAMQLVENRKLNLDDDVRTLVPEFPDKGVKITTRDLLRHQSGIVHYSNGKVIRSRKRYRTTNPFKDVVVALDTFKDSPLVAKPHEKFSYTSHGYILLSAVVERAGKAPFSRQVATRISTPLGLKTLQPDYQWKQIPHRAIGYRKIGNSIVRSTNTDVSWKLGGGGFISGIDDFARFAAAIVNGELINRDTQELMWAQQKTRSGGSTPVGLGVYVDGHGRSLRVAHSGKQEKVRTRLVTYPNRKSAVVVVTNSEYVDPGKFTTAVYTTLSK